MVIKNVKPFKPPVAPVGIPIIGQGPETLPPQVRDALGRVLAEGDLILLQTLTLQPYKILKLQPMPAAPGQPPGLMDVVLQSTVRFAALRDQPNAEFMRIMPATDAHALQRVPVGPPEATPIGPDSPPEEGA